MDMKKNQQLNVKYAMIQGLYWMIYCSAVGYASVYLLDKGLDNSTIGIILAIANILTTIVQPGLASYIDKKNLSIKNVITIIFGFIVIVSISMMFLSNVSIILKVLFTIVSTLLMCTVPLLNSLTFVFEEKGYSINFGLARGIGSAAYAISSLLLGLILEKYSPSLLPIIYIILTIGIIPLFYSFTLSKEDETSIEVKKEDETVEKEERSLLDFIKTYKKFNFLLIGIILVFFDHVVINSFFIHIINNVGGKSSHMGKAVFLAAIVELPMMAYFNTLKNKLKCGNIIIFSSFFFTIKHILTYFATNLTMLYIAQAMQMFAYALFIPASVFYVSKLVHERDLVKGQSLVTMAQTFAGIFASFFGGILLDKLGVQQTLLIGAIISFLGTVLIFFSSERTI